MMRYYSDKVLVLGQPGKELSLHFAVDAKICCQCSSQILYPDALACRKGTRIDEMFEDIREVLSICQDTWRFWMPFCSNLARLLITRTGRDFVFAPWSTFLSTFFQSPKWFVVPTKNITE
ncbi:uncharacterized protein LOC111382649 [Olea europaea var. sylvestris]|uniref:uncharacterized protein LOC111382649 n=1 Tax=Olea europaea var. sylvestris TaxID=158386 RepID=UPI000C1D3F23|nr:uncharacterized protein LOC111382649 [Olea europaea var. sylvestris]XP_022862443.1 uncharacterized protein LOC111382649 [Olea europaea var. sylvestris]XP_022862444.1 uncharacterized protein LOC111382649 [Olea europaea var. sylvestris]XP_022862445.1 uncharacterized protein LOC111382649 [Olea europaea var. sylvestris]XP_022862446.1 uncharacterized protein LOC111382649 [Olea europaea var. sylvestris]